jgi:hypothetical protein
LCCACRLQICNWAQLRASAALLVAHDIQKNKAQ